MSTPLPNDDQFKRLKAAYDRALLAAKEAAAACPDDAGSANLDSVYLYGLTGVHERRLTSEGINCYRKGIGEFFLVDGGYGQGNRRYAAVQAMYKSLKADGIDCCSIWYRMD